MTKKRQKIIPLGHRVLVKPDKAVLTRKIIKDDGTEIEIKIVESQRIRDRQIVEGVLVAVGPDAWAAFRKLDENGNEVNGKPWAKVGDRVRFAKHSGVRVLDPNDPEDEDAELIIMQDDDLQAVIVDIEEDE